MFFFFFFSSRRRHTRSLCDWSSDVCSSDLLERRHVHSADAAEAARRAEVTLIEALVAGGEERDVIGARARAGLKIGRASCRERVEISVGGGSLKKKRRE